MAATSFFSELKRRNVIRMAGLYLVGAWLIVQVAGTVLPMFGAPAWMPRSVVLLLAIGFVPVLLFSWVYELTPEGLKRDAEVPPEQSIGKQTAQRMEHLLVVLLLVAVGYFAFDKFVLAPKRQTEAVAAEGRSHSEAAAHGKSIAVLPFENLSEDKNNGFFADGIQDQVLTSLAKIGELKVISRTSTQKYAARPENLSQIARELGVEHILEGSVQRAGNQVRINVQLIEAATDSHLWAETYDRKLEDVFAVQSEVAQNIAQALAAKLSRGEREAISTKPTEVPAAYEAYLRGRALVAHVAQTPKEGQELLAPFREAVRLDPKFALGWAELARWCFLISWGGLDPSGELNAEGTWALERALALAPDLPQAELARGVRMYYVDHDFSGALAVMRSLTTRLPNDAGVWLNVGYLSRRLGRFDESLRAFARAHELSPNDGGIAYHYGVTYVVSGDCAGGLPMLDASLALDPKNTHALAMKLQCAWLDGDLARAEAYLAQADTNDSAIVGMRGLQRMLQHDYPAAARELQRAVDSGSDTTIDTFLGGYAPARLEWRLQLALAQQHLGQREAAATNYRGVQAEANAALARKIENSYVEAAWRAALGTALAGLGQRAEAAEQSRRMEALVTEERDKLEGPGFTLVRTRILALSGDAAGAVPLLRHLLGVTSATLAAPNLRLDPMFDPIRDDPAFQALLANPPKAQASP